MDDVYEHVATKAQKCISTTPVILLSSGASVPFGIPNMDQLGEHLVKSVSFNSQNEQDIWKNLASKLSVGGNLECVLAKDNLPRKVVNRVVIETWSYLCKEDEKQFQKLLNGQFVHPISQLFQCILRSGVDGIEIVTTNYDRIIEYACSAVRLHCATDFWPGYAWQYKNGRKLELFQSNRKLPAVNLRKVHGSLDWFKRTDGSIIQAPLFDCRISGLEPLIVTPGISKFEKVQHEPFRTINREADDAIENAKGYLCVGFGFRDRHIDEKMRHVLTERNLPIVVITKKTTPETNSLIERCSPKNYLIIEESQDGSIARTNEYPDGLDLKNDYWSIQGFLNFLT